jgi:MFS family permease
LSALATTVIGDLVSPRERGQYQGYISGMWGFASLAGPVVGGYLAHNWHWSMIFWINLPLGALAVAVLNKPLKKLATVRSKHKLDLLGSGLVILATTSLMLLLTWGGSRYGWASAQILGLTAATLVFWFLFGLRIRHCDEPILPIEVLKNPIVAAGTASNSFSMAVNLGLGVYIPLYMQAVRHLDPTRAGTSLIPLTVSMVCGAAFSGWMTTRLQHYKRTALTGLTTATFGLFWLAACASKLHFLMVGSRSNGYWRWYRNDLSLGCRLCAERSGSRPSGCSDRRAHVSSFTRRRNGGLNPGHHLSELRIRPKCWGRKRARQF